MNTICAKHDEIMKKTDKINKLCEDLFDTLDIENAEKVESILSDIKWESNDINSITQGAKDDGISMEKELREKNNTIDDLENTIEIRDNQIKELENTIDRLQNEIRNTDINQAANNFDEMIRINKGG